MAPDRRSRTATILTAVYEALERGDDPNDAAVASATGWASNHYEETVAELIDRGFLDGFVQRNGSGAVAMLMVSGLKPRGYDEAEELIRHNDSARWEHKAVSRPPHSLQESIGDRNKVFLVSGRNAGATNAVTDLLAAAGLTVISWEEAVKAAGGGSPDVLNIVRAGMRAATATVVLFTPDEYGSLDPRLSHESNEHHPLTARPRQNVIFEAGMALAHDESRAVLVEIGRIEGMSDLAGRHAIRLDNSPERRKALLQRLRDMGCAVNLDGERWMTVADFVAVVHKPEKFYLQANAVNRPELPDVERSGEDRLLRYSPAGSMAPDGHPAALLLRVVFVSPGDLDHSHGGQRVTKMSGERREGLLSGLLDNVQLTEWVTRASTERLHWEPYGYNSGECSELILAATSHSASRWCARCSVTTGTAASDGVRVPSLRMLADLALCEPHGALSAQTLSAPRLTLPDVLDASAALLSLGDVVGATYQSLIGTEPPRRMRLACWISTTPRPFDEIVDANSYRRIRGVSGTNEASVTMTVSTESPDFRSDLAHDLLAEVLERSGRRGFAADLRRLAQQRIHG